ncbi:ABC transporter ATP-binding protein [Spirochaetia bacterium]|nr:ABC transporter ATP-binding protein [Spirochaetia bacterium]
MEKVLSVSALETSFAVKAGEVQAVRGVSFDVYRGEILGIVGESGSGKSVTSFSILRVLADNARLKGGEIHFNGRDILKLPEKELRAIRGGKISMIFQDPMTSLSPLMHIGRQIEEALLEHDKDLNREGARSKALELLKKVHIPDAEFRYSAYPHELSGGMRQRVMIAMALSCKPELLIADEPTTALDVTIQAQILQLLKEMRDELNLSVVFITHDLGVVAGICDRVLVMYGGLVMEEGTADELFYHPGHPYTVGLLASIPRLNQNRDEPLRPIGGSPPDMLDPPAGCPFYPRCRWARHICVTQRPPYAALSESHRSMCHLWAAEAPVADNPFAAKKGVPHG